MKIMRDSKFSPRYFGPYKVLQRISTVAYRLQLPDSAKIHNTFHVSLLKKKIGANDLVQMDPSTILDVQSPKQPLRILDRRLINRNHTAIVSALVQWKGMLPEDATWIDYDELRKHFPDFVSVDASSSGGGHC